MRAFYWMCAVDLRKNGPPIIESAPGARFDHGLLEEVMKTAMQDWEQQWSAPLTGLDQLAPLLALALAAIIALL
jgi:hypothetical protein